MERREAKNALRRRMPAKNKDQVPRPPARTLAAPPVVRPPSKEIKVAALAVNLNVRLRSADMPAVMQEFALRSARALLDANPDQKKPNDPQEGI